MIRIHPQYLTLSKLLDGRLFRIPEYQRAYSWTSNERKDLFRDIEKVRAKGQDAGHFMATVVCLRREKQTLGTDEFHVLEVVDGQQRLTTLIILLNVIKLALNCKDKAEAKLARELSELLVKVEGDELLLLQTNHDNGHYFATFLRKGTSPASASATTLANREILRAIKDCQAFTVTWTDDGESLSSLAALLKNRLFFLLHEIEGRTDGLHGLRGLEQPRVGRVVAGPSQEHPDGDGVRAEERQSGGSGQGPAHLLARYLQRHRATSGPEYRSSPVCGHSQCHGHA